MMRGLSAPSLVSSSNLPEVMITTAANTATESSPLQQAAACADALLHVRVRCFNWLALPPDGAEVRLRGPSEQGGTQASNNCPSRGWVSCDRRASASAWF